MTTTRSDRKAASRMEWVTLLEREQGATVEEMAAALGQQQHTARGVLPGTLKKRFGLPIVSKVFEGQGRVYRIEGVTKAGAGEVDGAGQ